MDSFLRLSCLNCIVPTLVAISLLSVCFAEYTGQKCAGTEVASRMAFWSPTKDNNTKEWNFSAISHIPLPAISSTGFEVQAGHLGMNMFARRKLHAELDRIAAPWRDGTVNATFGYPPLSATGGFSLRTEPLHDNFHQGLDPDNFVILMQKGSQPQNIDIVADIVDGELRNVLQLRATANADPNVDPDHWWVSQSAILQTANIFASGRFEIRAKFRPVKGLVFALWTFHEELHRDASHLPFGETDPQYVPDVTGWDTRLNHEIDIEIPASCSGLCSESKTGCVGQFDTANLNNYVFSNSNGGGNAYSNMCVRAPDGRSFIPNDGMYHSYAFEWHTGVNASEDNVEQANSSNCSAARVDFFLDSVYVATNDVFVPSRGSRFVFGVWGGSTKWVGEPSQWPDPSGSPSEKTISAANISEVHICPFTESGDANYPMLYDQSITSPERRLWQEKTVPPSVPDEPLPSVHCPSPYVPKQ